MFKLNAMMLALHLASAIAMGNTAAKEEPAEYFEEELNEDELEMRTNTERYTALALGHSSTWQNLGLSLGSRLSPNENINLTVGYGYFEGSEVFKETDLTFAGTFWGSKVGYVYEFEWPFILEFAGGLLIGRQNSKQRGFQNEDEIASAELRGVLANIEMSVKLQIQINETFFVRWVLFGLGRPFLLAKRFTGNAPQDRAERWLTKTQGWGVVGINIGAAI